jgi:hypothetical protein
MAFSFGRKAKASKSTTPYMGGELGFSKSQMHQGYMAGYSPLQKATEPKGMARLPMEHTAARQYRDVPISQRPTTSMSNPDLTKRVLAARTRQNVANSQAARRAASGGYKASGVGSDLVYGPGRKEFVESNVRGSRAIRESVAATKTNRMKTNIKRNVGISRNSRSGGFRAANLGAAPIGGSGSRGHIMANIEANRAGNAASRFRNAQGFVGEYGPTRADMIRNNVRISREGRSGGFRSSGVGAAPPPRGATTTAADLAEGAMHGPGRAELEAIRRAGKTNTKKPMASMMKNKKGLAIGLGAAVIGGLAYSGRRGEGSSGGRTSQYRY